MLRISLFLLFIGSLCGAVEEVEAAFDQRVLIACATNPEAKSYLYLEKYLAQDDSAKKYLKDVNADAVLDWAAKKNKFGLAQAGVGFLIKANNIEPAVIRKVSLLVLANMNQKDVFFGKAKPAFAWLQIEDKGDLNTEQFADISPLLKNPLVAATVYKSVPDKSVLDLIRGEKFSELDSSIQVNLLETALNRKLITPTDAGIEEKLQNAAKGSFDGKIAWFTYTQRRDAAIVTEYEATIEALAKKNDQMGLMVLLSQTPDLRSKIDIQNLHLNDALKTKILKMNAGGDFILESEEQQP